MKNKKTWFVVPLIAVLLIGAFVVFSRGPEKHQYSVSVDAVPEFNGAPYVVINENEPEFSEDDITAEAYEFYSELDALNRCGYAIASVGLELMPEEERGQIGQVKPSGWQTVKYDFVDGKYLYNRCHLIGFQLTGENANERNLITGTRYMNVQGMLPFENMVADYVKETGNHVLYRVTPVYDGDNLVARGVQMEAYSVEDDGEGVLFNVYVYNNQPGVVIDYATGESWSDVTQVTGEIAVYILNTNSQKFHSEDCELAENIKDSNKEIYEGTRDLLITQGYSPCGSCQP